MLPLSYLRSIRKVQDIGMNLVRNLPVIVNIMTRARMTMARNHLRLMWLRSTVSLRKHSNYHVVSQYLGLRMFVRTNY